MVVIQARKQPDKFIRKQGRQLALVSLENATVYHSRAGAQLSMKSTINRFYLKDKYGLAESDFKYRDLKVELVPE